MTEFYPSRSLVETSTRRIVLTAGGTGGHLFPAQALAEQLLRIAPDCTLLFAGHGLKDHPCFAQDRFSFQEIPCGSFQRRVFWKNLLNVGKIVAGIVRAVLLLLQFRPCIVIGFGGYPTFPLLFAAWILRVPIALHEGNSVMGRVNAFFAKKAVLCAAFFPSVIQAWGNRITLTDFPLRTGYCPLVSNKTKLAHYFELSQNTFTLLCFGGSQGAQLLNSLIPEALHLFSAKKSHFQVIHITGKAEEEEAVTRAYESYGIRACTKWFESHMVRAWQMADLVICRSGAGTIAEQLEMEVPALFLPYPYCRDSHQEENANFVVSIGGGRVCNPNKEELAETLATLLQSDSSPLRKMKQALYEYKQQMATRKRFLSLTCEQIGLYVR